VAVAERSVSLHVYENTRTLEEAFRAAIYEQPQGDQIIRNANDAVWQKALKLFLVDWNKV